MKNILLNLDNWRARLAHEPLAVFLDYDGTLSAIALTPAEAKLPFATQEVLKALIRYKNVKVAIISGRELIDLRKMIPVKGLSYVGSHGIEFLARGLTSQRISKRYLKELGELGSRLQCELGGSSGIFFEWKAFSLAVHYRKASPGSEKKAKQVVLDICHDAVHCGRISILLGKKVIEIMPPTAMDKGQAVERLLKIWGRKKYLPIFIGDDRTDESAFEVLRGCGLTVKVGGPDVRSGAEYYLNSVGDVRRLLRMILYFRSS
ncbi:MAG: trehalose-phosphatase [Candidatus Omnitrophica bacterium]|nr:trehalose-phosphatase [Candidatus Omnitrophota bacterium]